MYICKNCDKEFLKNIANDLMEIKKSCILDKELFAINKTKIKKYLDYATQKYDKYFYKKLYNGTVA